MNPPSDPQAEKRVLRARVRAAVAAMTPAQKGSESAVICERLLGLELFQRSRVVLLYVPLSDEPLIDPVARSALAGGKTVLAPRPDWTTGSMTGALVQDWPGDLERDPKGLLIPRQDAPAYDPDSIHCVVVPGVAFTLTGVRLGRGRGFYDRYLAQVPIHRRVGVCYRCQLVDSIPPQDHDQAMARVITG